MKTLVINPGSTSRKIAIYEGIKPLWTKTLRHSAEEISKYPKIIDQYEFRKQIIIESLEEAGVDLNEIEAVVGRGGLLKPIPGGIYLVNDKLIADLRKEMMGEHASNLGGLIANEIVKVIGNNTKAYIVDPVVVDEMDDIARFSGSPELPRLSIFHALNQKAVARRYARDVQKKYQELSLIVVHLGGGISIGVHKGGRVIDVNNALNGEGPFSPERTGTVPVAALTKLCYSGKYTEAEMLKKLTGKGGMYAYLGTTDAKEVEDKAAAGDEKCMQVYKAMAYQIAKEIGAAATVLKGKIDAILITGGLAYSYLFEEWFEDYVGFLAPIKFYPGEDEMQALAESVYYSSTGEIEIKEYN